MTKVTSTPTEEADHSAIGLHPLKRVVDKSLSAFNDLNAQSKNNVEAAVASTVAVTQGAKALQSQFFTFGKQTFADNLAAAGALATARSLDDIVELQTNWAKSAMSAYVAELTRASETITGAFKASFEPLSERMTAVAKKYQGVS